MGNSDYPDNPPTYEEALAETVSANGRQGSASHSQSSAAPRQSRPTSSGPSRPSTGTSTSTRTSTGTTTSTSTSTRTNFTDAYTANLNLPWRYPKDEFCKRCSNTGYKPRHGKRCKRCWKKYAPAEYYGYAAKPQSPQTRPAAAHPNVVHVSRQMYVPAMPLAGVGSPLGSMVSGMLPPMRPQVVRPGDPSLGGRLCANCRGSGSVQFFLDRETCSSCKGVGRVF